MSNQNKIITERNNTSLYDKNKNAKIEEISQITKSYKYVYTNTNNTQKISNKVKNKNITENSNHLAFNNNMNKMKYIPKNQILSLGNITNQSPSKLKCDVETNYSINKITNVKFVNGSNKHFSNMNYIRSPDLQFISNKKSEKIINTERNNNKIIKKEFEEKCLCDQNSNCICGKRRYNRYDRQLFEERKRKRKINLNQENNIYSNHSKKIIKNIKNNYYDNENINYNYNYNYNHNNIYGLNSTKNFEKTRKFETSPGFFSDEDINSMVKSKLQNTKHKSIRYSSPNYFGNNRNIKISKYYNQNYNTYDKIDKYNNNSNQINNINNINICTCSKNNNYLSKKRNHNFKSISECSYRNINTNKNQKINTNINVYSYRNNDIINKNLETNRKYQYDIKIHNINVNKKNRSFSYENFRNNKIIESNRYSSEKYKRERITSFDKRQLRIQNAQNMQVIQDEKIYQIIVPIPPNKIENSCDIQISGSDKKKYTMEEINEIIKRKKIETKQYINEKEILNNNVKKEIIVTNRKEKIKIKPNWNKTNKAIGAEQLSFDFNKKVVPPKKIEKKPELNVENFEINISDNGRQFRGEMLIENNSLEYEKQEKDPNSNLLLSPNTKLYLNADYPKRNWNNITRPISGRPLSIESKNKKVLLERSAEKLSIKGNRPKNDWNISNNEKKEININLYQKKRPNLSKEKMQPFVIKGKEKNWNFITRKENESKLTIKGIEKKNEISENDDELIIINDDYNKIENNKNYKINFNIKKVQENSENSEKSEDFEKDIFKKNSEQKFDYKENIKEMFNSPMEQKITINNIKGYYPNGIEVYQGKNGKEENSQTIIQENYKIYHQYKNLIIEPRTPEKEITKYYYREVITNIPDDINNNENEKNENDINNLDNDLVDSDNKEKTKSETNSPKSQTRYRYRENIETSSPSRTNNIISISKTPSNQSKNFDNQNDEISNRDSRPLSISNINNINNNNIDNNYINVKINNENGEEENNHYYQNQNNQNQIQQKINNNIENKNYYYKEKKEQQIPSIIEEDEGQKLNNNYIYNYNQKINDQSPKKYIYKIGKQNINLSKPYMNQIITNQQNNIEETTRYKNMNMNMNTNTLYSQQKGNNNQIINQQKMTEIKYNNNNNYNNINNQEQQQPQIQNVIIQGRIVQSQIFTHNQETQENQEYMNSNQHQNNEINNINIYKSEIINKDYLNNIDDHNNLNSAYFQQQQNDLSQSQEIPSSSIPQNGNKNKNKYTNLIQEYSNHLKTNPIDNYNNFATNKYNIIPMSAGRYGNIILNNSIKTSKNFYTNRISQTNVESNNNNINVQNLDMNNPSSYSFGVETSIVNKNYKTSHP